MQFIDLKAQYKTLEERINSRIQTVLQHGKYIMGPEVAELEEQLSVFSSARHSISCANGTDALQLALMALDVGPGDAVFTTPFTFFATAEVISLCGARPIFVDVEEDTFNIDPSKLKTTIEHVRSDGRLTPRAVIAVDLFGLPANYEALEIICKEDELKLIEDAAQGLGGKLNGRAAGSFGDIATTSFFPAKPLGCYGDGGAVFTSNDELAARLRSLRIHGKGSDKYDNVRIGLNSRLDTLQAAVLLEKLSVFREEIRRRQKVADTYSESLRNVVDLYTPCIPEGYQSVWAQYTLRSNDRDKITTRLNQAGVPTAIYYPTPLHLLAAFSDLGYGAGDFPVSERLSETVFSVPMHPYLLPEQQQQVIDALIAS